MTFGVVLLLLLFFTVAFLYGSVGHGGASGYIALMVLVGFSQATIRPVALLMNIAVALIGTIQFYRGGHFRKELLFPFLLLSVVMAYAGARITLSEQVFKSLLGVCLSIAVFRLLIGTRSVDVHPRPLPFIPAVVSGGAIGWISGMIGIGGGVLLSPLLLLGRWATLRQAAAVAAPFILVNSLAAIVSGGIQLQGISYFHLSCWVLAVIAGGWLGSYAGSMRFPPVYLRYILATVLLIAVGKLFIS